MPALLVESLLPSDIFSLLLLVGGQSSVDGELLVILVSCQLFLVERLLPSDSYSLVSVVVLWCVALIPYHARCFLVCRLLSSESYSLVGGSVLSHRASWWLVGRLRW